MTDTTRSSLAMIFFFLGLVLCVVGLNASFDCPTLAIFYFITAGILMVACFISIQY